MPRARQIFWAAMLTASVKVLALSCPVFAIFPFCYFFVYFPFTCMTIAEQKALVKDEALVKQAAEDASLQFIGSA